MALTIAEAVRRSVERAEKAEQLLAEAEHPQAYTTTPTGKPVTEHYHVVPGPGATVEPGPGILLAAGAYAALAEAYARLAGAMVVNAAAMSDVASSVPPSGERH